MKSRLTLILGVGLLILLAACNSTPPAPATTEQATAPANPTQAVVATTYPEPLQSGTSYPAPAVITTTQSQSASLYPGPKSGDTISWEQAVALIRNLEVSSLSETGTKLVLNLKDGRSLNTTEPASGDFQALLQRCGERCKDIKVNPSQ
jgi:uncharacterized lipoprotein